MNTANSINLRPQILLWYAGIFMVLLLLAGMLARNWFQASLLLVAIGWALTLPYHAAIASSVSLAFFGSAFLVPFAPGPLPVADAASMLAWSGVPLVLLLRSYPADAGTLFRSNLGVFIGIAIYLCVLAVLMKAHGVGFGFLGARTGGGRIYFQQVVYAIIPLLFLVAPFDEKLFLRLVLLHFVLSLSYLVSEATLTYFPSLNNIVLRLFQLPTDALAFEVTMTRQFGFRRMQSLFYTCPKLIFAILMFYSTREVLGRKGWWLLPLMGGLLAAGLWSGHRANLIHTGFVLLLLFWVQRGFTPRNIMLMTFCLLPLLALTYLTSPLMPAAVQRAVSFLPGIHVEATVAADAASTWYARTEVARIGIGMIPQYFWLGRGFTRYADVIPGSQEALDSITFAVLQGHFLNGFVGLMVNTGVFGTIGMMVFLFSGVRLAARVLRRVRETNFETTLDRTSAVICSIYLVDVVFFFLIEGNADWALRRFGMYVGMLFVCWRLLDRRDRQTST